MTSLERLHPAYFAMVMATGIVSVACKLLGLGLLADVLLAVNVVTYVVLWALTVARVARAKSRCRTSSTPWASPQTTKVKRAPCQSPPSVMVTRSAKAVRSSLPREPPSGMKR